MVQHIVHRHAPRAAERYGFTVVFDIEETGSGANNQRPGLVQVLAAGVRFIALTQGIDIRPGGDAMSRLLLTMLSAVVEFERDLIVERTRLGPERACRAGKRLGRTPIPTTPADRVLKLKGSTWEPIAARLKWSPWRRARSLDTLPLGPIFAAMRYCESLEEVRQQQELGTTNIWVRSKIGHLVDKTRWRWINRQKAVDGGTVDLFRAESACIEIV